MRVVIDACVLVAGLRSRLGASNKLLTLVAGRAIVPIVSTAVFLEYEAVLSRPEQRPVTRMSEKDIAGFLAAFASAAEPVELDFLWRPQLTDPADEMMLEAAVNGRARAIVTYNVRHFAAAERLFGLKIVTPAALLKEIRR
jgi:putative PIN family toxin of toxin-antitoxin system